MPTTCGCSAQQAKRCRAILAKLTELSSGDPFDRMKLSTLIEEAVAPHRDFGVAINVALSAGDVDEPVGGRSPAILYGLEPLENAVDFARERVDVAASWSGQDSAVTITDDGPGFVRRSWTEFCQPLRHQLRQQRQSVDGEASGLGRLLHCEDAAGALGGDARFREPRLSGPGGDRARALGRNDFERSMAFAS